MDEPGSGPLTPARRRSARDRSCSGDDRTGGEAQSSAPTPRVCSLLHCWPLGGCPSQRHLENSVSHPRVEGGQELSGDWRFNVRGEGRWEAGD